MQDDPQPDPPDDTGSGDTHAVCQGAVGCADAEAMGKRPVTIRNTIYRIRGKLECTSRQELVVWAVRHGLLNPDQ